MADSKLSALPSLGTVAQTSLMYVVDAATSYQCTVSQLPCNIIWRDEGTNIATAGQAMIVDFVGTGVSAAYAAGKVTVTINGVVGLTDGDKGDITVSGTGTVWTIDAASVTNTKLANMANATVKGRATAGTGVPEDLTLDTGLVMTGTALGLSLNALATTTPHVLADFAAGANTPNVKFKLWETVSAARYFFKLEDECLNTTDAFTGFNAAISGTGSSAAGGTGDDKHIGIITFNTGTTTTGRAAITTTATAFRLGGGACKCMVIFRTSTLSDGTDTYTIRVGLGDSTSGEHTDGVFIRYTDAVNGGRFQFVTRSNGTETATDTGITVVASTWYNVEIDINAGATSAQCTINQSGATTNTTNIPSGAGRELGIVPLFILKSAGTTGRSADLDYVLCVIDFTTAR
jgi:hypothetical protein